MGTEEPVLSLITHIDEQEYGTFLSLSGKQKDFGKKSRLITPMVKANTGQTCALRFFYYMFGNNLQMGSLSVYIRYREHID